MDAIYLDGQATTPTDPAVGEAMAPWLSGSTYGNPDSPHIVGANAQQRLAAARRDIAASTGADPASVILTSGATESNNLAVRVLNADPGHVLVGETEHASVLRPLESLARAGSIDLEVVPVGDTGAASVEAIASRLRPETRFISIMLANNETGMISPIASIAALLRPTAAIFHCDAAQGLGRLPLDMGALGVDLLSISGHKAYGPMGTGALLANQDARQRLAPILLGGGQEHGQRSGTSNLPGAVGLAAAARLASERVASDAARMGRLQAIMEEELTDKLDARVNGSGERLPGTMSITLPGTPVDAVLGRCPELALSTGSACSSGSPRTSHVLTAMGLSAEEAECTFRVGITRLNTEAEIRTAAVRIVEAARRVRSVVHA